MNGNTKYIHLDGINAGGIIISTVIVPLPLNHSRSAVVSYNRNYVHEVLVYRLFESAVRRTDRPATTIVVAWDVKQQDKQTNYVAVVLNNFEF